MVIVKGERNTPIVACSRCMGEGSFTRGRGKRKAVDWMTCPDCYGTGMKDMRYEMVVRHGSS